MKLIDYVAGKRQRTMLAEIRAFADACGVHEVYMWQLVHRWHNARPGAKLADRIVAATGGKVSYEDLYRDYDDPRLWHAGKSHKHDKRK